MLKFLDEILLYVKNQITQDKDEMLSLNKITKATNNDKASDILNIMMYNIKGFIECKKLDFKFIKI